MLLNGQRLFYLVALIATLSLVGCVDIPTNGPTPPNYRSSIKFFHAGRTVDTIAFPISKISYARKDSVQSTLSIGGTDSVRTKVLYEQSITVARYRRYQVNFAQTVDVHIDGALKSTLALGATSTYFDVASGNRLFTLKGNGTFIDSITIVKIDTLVTTYRDSIKGNTVTARLVSDTTRDGRIVKFITVPNVTAKITIDSIATTVETERQYSMYFVGRTQAIEQNENGLARFGKIQFLSTQERLLFQPIGRTDSAVVKFVNAYPDVAPDTGVAVILKGGKPTDDIARLSFGTAASKIYPCRNDTTYTFFIRKGAADTVATVSLPVSKTKSYTIMTFSSAGVRTTQAYTH